MEKLNINAKKILIWHLFFRLGSLLSSIFLNIYIFKQTWDLKIVALFNIILLFFMTIFFVVIGWIIKNKYRRFLYFFACLWNALTFLFLAILWKHSIEYIYIFAIFFWIFAWAYRVIHHTNQIDNTKIANRWKFEGTLRSLVMILKLLTPIIAGFIISSFSYGYNIIFLLSSISFLLSAFIGNIKINYSKNKLNYHLWETFKLLISDKTFSYILVLQFLIAFMVGSPFVEKILPLILYSFNNSESELGLLIGFFTLISIVGSYLLWKFFSKKLYKQIGIIFSLVYAFSLIIIIIFPFYTIYSIFSAILLLSITFISVPYKVISDNAMWERKDFEKHRIEYIVIREIFLNSGRIFLLIILFFSWDMKQENLRFLLYIVLIISILYPLFYMRLFKKD